MKKSKLLLLVTILILSISILACAFGGNNNNDNMEEAPTAQNGPVAEEPAQEEVSEEAPVAEAAASIETDFPVLADAQNMMETNGTLIYQSKASLQEAFDFYKAELSTAGLTENDILTMNEDTMFQLVYTGTEDGRSLVVQTIQLDETTINVTVRYE